MSTLTERIELIAKVFQTIAVIIGIAVAVNEFVLKDRELEAKRFDITLNQINNGQTKPVMAARRKLHELREFAYRTPSGTDKESELQEFTMRISVGEHFNVETRELAHFYNIISSCGESGFCNRDLILALICEDAYRDLYAIDELNGRVGNRFFTPTYFSGLVSIQHACPHQKPIEILYLSSREQKERD